MKKYFARLSQGSMCSTYPTCRIAVYSLGYALGAVRCSSPTPHGGDTTTNVPSSKTKTTNSAANTNLNATIFTSSVKRNDTATIIFAGVRLLNEGVKNFKPSTSLSLRNSKRSWQNRKRNCKAIMPQRAGQRSTLGWIKLSMKEQILKENSESYSHKKFAPLDDLTSREAEIIFRGMTLRNKMKKQVSHRQPIFLMQVQIKKFEGQYFRTKSPSKS